MENVYNTTDPKKLLALKRLEADALLDVLRTINQSELSISRLCLIARNVLRAQLGVKKILFYYEQNQQLTLGIKLGFSPISDGIIDEIQQFITLSAVDAEKFPILAQLEAEYIIPISNQAEAKAYFIIADFADTEDEAQGDLIFIETLGNILSVAIQNRQLFQENMQRELLMRELEVAETIQKQLLISDFSRFKRIDIHGVNVPHYHVGGDFCDVIKKGKQETFVCIADVSGKGIAAALLMSNVQANLRALCAQYSDLSLIIQELNRRLYQVTAGEKFVTLFLGRVDSINQKFTYVNAGHNYPVYVNDSGIRELNKGSVLLGIMPQIGIQEEELTYQSGDTLFMFTDGLVEQQGEHGEMYGTERLTQQLTLQTFETAQETLTYIHQDVSSFSNETKLDDDITMLVLKFLPEDIPS